MLNPPEGVVEARELAIVGDDGLLVLLMRGVRAAYVSKGKHTSAYLLLSEDLVLLRSTSSIRQHTSAYAAVSIR
jgi:hypothetical protein